jgi:UDP-3-O-[3-hydroxymyristoyl] glucosamine N-acyltransferase
MAMTVAQLAERLGLEVRGDGGASLTHAAALEDAGSGALSFALSGVREVLLRTTRASAVIVAPAQAPECPTTALISPTPHVSFAQALGVLQPRQRPEPGIHPSAVIGESVSLAAGVSIGPLSVIGADCVLGEDVEIGPGCMLEAGVQLGTRVRLVARVTLGSRTVIGEDSIIHPGAVIGADGFGYARHANAWFKVPQVGRVVLGRDVEVGANTAIDRGALGDTRIGDGTKIDNLVHIAHNCQIGQNVAIAAGVGIAGSTQVGDHCAIGGMSGVAGHVRIAGGVQFTGMSQVTGHVTEPGVYSSGTGLLPNARWRRMVGRLQKLDEMARTLREVHKAFSRHFPGRQIP